MIQWSPGYTLEMIEEEVIKRALQYFRGNKTRTADALGISIRTIDNKLEKYNIDNPKTDVQPEVKVEATVEQLPVPQSAVLDMPINKKALRRR